LEEIEEVAKGVICEMKDNSWQAASSAWEKCMPAMITVLMVNGSHLLEWLGEGNVE
jgi:hypothetical protein